MKKTKYDIKKKKEIDWHKRKVTKGKKRIITRILRSPVFFSYKRLELAYNYSK